MKHICISVIMLTLLSTCGTPHTGGRRTDASTRAEDTMTYAQRRKFDYFFLEAVRMRLKGEHDAAFQLYDHCLDICPQSAAALYEISRFYMSLGQETKGEDALMRASRADSSNFWYRQTLASWYQSKKDLPKATAVYEEMARIFPSRLEPLLSLANLYGGTSDFAALLQVLDRIEEVDGKSEQLTMEKFRACMQAGDTERAYDEIKALAEEYPYDMRYRTLTGDALLAAGRKEEALNVYQEILREMPGYAPAMVSVASYYRETGQDSLYALQVDSILMSGNVETELKLDFLRQITDRRSTSGEDTTRIIRLFDAMMSHPLKDADIPMIYAQYFARKKMYSKSAMALERVLEIEPENEDARMALLGFAVMNGNNDEVIRVATPALDYGTEKLELYYFLGLAHYSKGNTDRTLEILGKGARLTGGGRDKDLVSGIWSILGDIYHTQGKNTEAYAAYDSSLVYNPENSNTLNNYAYFLSEERNSLDRAEEMSFITVKAEPENATYLDTYAWILFMKGRYTEAWIYMEQAIANGGDKSAEITEHCGDIRFMLGDTDGAMEFWRKAVSIDDAPEDTSTRTKEEKERLKRKIRLRRYVE